VTAAPRAVAHSPAEDAVAYLTGTLLIALGVTLVGRAGLVTGGTVGLAILLQHLTGAGFAPVFVAVNLPFVVLAWRTLGRAFTLRSACAVGLLATIAGLMPRWLAIDSVQPAYAAVAGGLAIGVGLLILLRHRASLGGFGVFALWLAGRRGTSVGLVQLALDAAVLLASAAFLPASTAALSLLSAAVLNLALAVNHRPGRYLPS
jgi:uncharacterized membrane-anchored protein YitT (DUF2179 family)